MQLESLAPCSQGKTSGWGIWSWVRWSSAASLTGPTLAPLGSIHLSAEECALIESFLNRRYDLEPYVRHDMADEILRRLKPKLTLPLESASSTERILEALAYERRATGRYP